MRRTITDWLSLASASVDPAEISRLLDHAAPEADACHAWRELLNGAAAIDGVAQTQLARFAEATLAAAKAERDVWGFRDVATVRVAKLDDRRGAGDALEACVAVLGSPRTDTLAEATALLGREIGTHGHEWVLLATGFRETLGDEDGARRCLELGRDEGRARQNADDLVSIASAWAEHVDRAEGIALLVEAETLAKNGSARAWTIANAFRALGDEDGARRVLDGALRDATTSEAARHVVAAWSCYERTDEALRAFERAEELAQSAEDWLALAEAALDGRLGNDVVRRALGRAAQRATDDTARARVAGAFAQWLGDEAAAARIGPRGLPPETLRKKARSLEGWETSASGLFDWLRARMTHEALTAIAHADYGEGAARHYAALRDICDTGVVPRMLVWEPHEVLALTRWSVGEKTDHLQRAFSCVLLCLSPSDFDELVTNGPILAESCLALGPDARAHAERFFAWYAETEPVTSRDGEPGVDHPLALLLLLVLRASASPNDARLDALVASIVEHPVHAPERVVEHIDESIRAQLWKDLVAEILVPQRSRPALGKLLAAMGW